MTTIQTNLTKLELQVQAILAVERPSEQPVIRLWLELTRHEIQEGMDIQAEPMRVVPHDLKVRHVDWQYFYDSIQKRKVEFGEKTYKEQVDFCNEIKAAIDNAQGWKD